MYIANDANAILLVVIASLGLQRDSSNSDTNTIIPLVSEIKLKKMGVIMS